MYLSIVEVFGGNATATEELVQSDNFDLRTSGTDNCRNIPHKNSSLSTIDI